MVGWTRDQLADRGCPGLSSWATTQAVIARPGGSAVSHRGAADSPFDQAGVLELPQPLDDDAPRPGPGQRIEPYRPLRQQDQDPRRPPLEQHLEGGRPVVTQGGTDDDSGSPVILVAYPPQRERPFWPRVHEQ
jgi:hypothetical protein